MSSVTELTSRRSAGVDSSAAKRKRKRAAPTRLQELYLRWERPLLGGAVLTAVLAAWQLAATYRIIRPEFFSYPTEIARTMVTYFGPDGGGWQDLAVSGKEFGIGFGLALVIGIPLGILMGAFRVFDSLLDPLTTILYNTPRIALAPLFVIWFGIGIPSKVAVVFLVSTFPMIINSRAGVTGTDPLLLAMARSYGARKIRVLWSIVLPGSVPAISSGIRIAVGQGLAAVVLAEFIASSEGLGYTIVTAANTLSTARLFDAVMVIAALGTILTAVFGRVEKHFDRWRT